MPATHAIPILIVALSVAGSATKEASCDPSAATSKSPSDSVGLLQVHNPARDVESAKPRRTGPPRLAALVAEAISRQTDANSSDEHNEVTTALQKDSGGAIGAFLYSRLAAAERPEQRKAVVYFPRAGLGNKLLGLASSIVTAVALDRPLFFAPADESEPFSCRELFQPEMCSLVMPDSLLAEYKGAKGEKSRRRDMRPEAYGGNCTEQHRDQMLDILCDGELTTFQPQFVTMSACQYYAGLWFANPNPNVRERLRRVFPDNAVWFPFISEWLRPSDAIKLREEAYVRAHPEMGEGDCISVHVRHGDDVLRHDCPLTMRFSDRITCLRLNKIKQKSDCRQATKCIKSLDSREQTAKPIFLATMHKTCRDFMSDSYPGRVHFATSEKPTGNLGNAADEKNALLDMVLLGRCRTVLLTEGSSFGHWARAVASHRRSTVLLSDQWGDSCASAEETAAPNVEPPSDLFKEDHDNCKVLSMGGQLRRKGGKDMCGSVPQIFLPIVGNVSGP